MENREIMLVSIFLILVSALAFNLNDFSITGYAIRDNSASLRLDPIIAKAGSDITITIAPASEGTSRFVEFYQDNEKRGETVRLCNQLRCTTRDMP